MREETEPRNPERAGVVPPPPAPDDEPKDVDITTIPGFAKLATLSERTEPLARRALQLIANKAADHNDANPERPIKVIVHSATRGDLEQLGIWAHGRRLIVGGNKWSRKGWKVIDPGLVRTNAFPGGSSAHRAPDGGPKGGDAVDIGIHDAITGEWLAGGGKPDPLWAEIVGATADEVGMVWGGRFHSMGRPFFDGAHLNHPAWRAPN